MGAKPIEVRPSRRSWLMLIAAGVLAVTPFPVPAAAPSAPDLPGRSATQKAVSTAAVSSVEWTASDFAAIGLMFLGAAVVFIPLPKLRLRKATPVPPEVTAVDGLPAATAARAELIPGTIDTSKTLVKSGINLTPVSS